MAANSSEVAKTNTNRKGTTMNSDNGKTEKVSGYAPVNGLKMYYEIEGAGDPLVFIPPAFGFAGLKSFPTLAQRHSVISRSPRKWSHGGYSRSPDFDRAVRRRRGRLVEISQNLKGRLPR